MGVVVDVIVIIGVLAFMLMCALGLILVINSFGLLVGSFVGCGIVVLLCLVLGES